MKRCALDSPRVHRGDLDLFPRSEVARVANIAKALSDPVRLQIVNFLRQRPELCTCEFEELLGLAQSKVSYHLRVLLEAGIVSRETYGTWSHYRLCNPHLLDQLYAVTSEMHNQVREPA